MPAAHAPLASLRVSALSGGGMANLDDMDMDDMFMMGVAKAKFHLMRIMATKKMKTTFFPHQCIANLLMKL